MDTKSVKNPRTYGRPPFSLAVIHGGPGAGGEMAPVARQLAPQWGVLEPIQTATRLEGQVMELCRALARHGTPPVTLVGYSWGAWLSYIVAARHPALVGRLILVGSGPLDETYTARLHETRLSRLDKAGRAEFETLLAALDEGTSGDQDALLARLSDLTARTDTYDPLPDTTGPVDRVVSQAQVFRGVWQDAVALRRSGALLALGRQIRCPVVAIHGAYDPHPAEGVERPLSDVLDDFQFILLPHCGHTPWRERQARDQFYRVLEQALRA